MNFLCFHCARNQWISGNLYVKSTECITRPQRRHQISHEPLRKRSKIVRASADIWRDNNNGTMPFALHLFIYLLTVCVMKLSPFIFCCIVLNSDGGQVCAQRRLLLALPIFVHAARWPLKWRENECGNNIRWQINNNFGIVRLLADERTNERNSFRFQLLAPKIDRFRCEDLGLYTARLVWYWFPHNFFLLFKYASTFWITTDQSVCTAKRT